MEEGELYELLEDKSCEEEAKNTLGRGAPANGSGRHSTQCSQGTKELKMNKALESDERDSEMQGCRKKGWRSRLYICPLQTFVCIRTVREGFLFKAHILISPSGKGRVLCIPTKCLGCTEAPFGHCKKLLNHASKLGFVLSLQDGKITKWTKKKGKEKKRRGRQI